MKTLKQLLVTLVLVISCWCLFTANAFSIPETLGKYPACELSAAVASACPDSIGTCLLVGDNENDDALYLYRLNSKKLESESQKELLLGGLNVGDIEALAKLDMNRVLILGSHSRNKKCITKEKRRRLLKVKVLSDRLEAINPVRESPEIQSKLLFEGVDLAKNKNLALVSLTIDEAEKAADLAKGNETACAKVNAFNAEGAVSIADDKVWIGLRSPLVDLNSEKNAVLLRAKSLQEYQFDAVAFLDLGGRGIRELTLDKSWVWGIAGGPEDEMHNFVLWRFPKEALKPNAELKPEVISVLPDSSEGLAIVDKTAYVLIDGDKGEGSKSCKDPGKYIQFDLN